MQPLSVARSSCRSAASIGVRRHMTWSFAIVETSNGAYRCTGTRHTGNTVSKQCGEDDLHRCGKIVCGKKTMCKPLFSNSFFKRAANKALRGAVGHVVKNVRGVPYPLFNPTERLDRLRDIPFQSVRLVAPNAPSRRESALHQEPFLLDIISL